MTMDLYGHLIDQNLWDAGQKIGGTTGARRELEAGMTKPPGEELASDLGVWVEPPVGIEPTTFSLRVRRSAD
ncbi:MAG: hypothetical protein QOF10_6529 [Kribbellaceae bacterium]|nr:hypothetical protein [Kribbellaceae bacterium]